MRILVDMDGVIANWGKTYDQHIDAFFPGLKLTKTAQQRSFDLMEGLDIRGRNAVKRIMDWPGFYRKLEPMPWAVQALQEMLFEGHDVHIVTSPWLTNPTCASDKVAWIAEHLGASWTKRLIITSDKTIIRGDILIDDKPEITGAMTPTWEHVIFTQPYNAEISDLRERLSNWEKWYYVTDRLEERDR